MSLSIIIPTVGRLSIGNTLRSIGEQATDEHVIVVSDGPRDEILATLVKAWAGGAPQARWTYGWFADGPSGTWGHTIRNVALDVHVDTTHVCTIDDDDVYLPGALETIRDAGCREKPVVFKARWGAGHPAAGVQLWHFPEMRYGNVATPMVVWPADAKARWGLRYEGDFDFYQQLEAEYGELYWDEREIAEVRPVAVERA